MATGFTRDVEVLVLNAYSYDFTPKDADRVQGVKATCVLPDVQEGRNIGYQVVAVNMPIDAWNASKGANIRSNGPGLYMVQLEQYTGREGNNQVVKYRAHSVELVERVDLFPVAVPA